MKYNTGKTGPDGFYVLAEGILPDDLPLPTCDACGETFIGRKEAYLIDRWAVTQRRKNRSRS